MVPQQTITNEIENNDAWEDLSNISTEPPNKRVKCEQCKFVITKKLKPKNNSFLIISFKST